MTAAIQRVRIRVEGVVQGVGFRPYVHRLATELGLDGFVRNDERGVVVEVEGDGAAVAALLARLPAEAPPLASVDRVVTEAVPARGARGFAIADSSAGPPDALVSPDVAVCADCLRELFDPADRRYRYPFINCTNCGPRFTIVRGVPYDRPHTTMAGFTMCARLRRGVPRPHRPPLPRPAQRLPRLRPHPPRKGDSPPYSRRAASGDGPPYACRGRPSCRCDRGGQRDRRVPSRVHGGRRGGGRAAACAQAPRGEAVRADGGRRAGRRRAGRPRADRGGAAARARPADRDRAAPARRARRSCRCAAHARARRDAAVQPAPPPAAARRRRAAGDDQRQRVRRADRLPRRRRARAARRRSPTSCSATTARSRRAPTIRCCGPRADARCRCGAPAARSRACSRCRSRQAGTCSRAAPSSRARSASPAGAAPGSATTSATSRTRRRWPRSRRGSRTSSGCSRSSRAWSRTICIPTTSPPRTRSRARASSTSPSSTTMRTWRPAWPSTGRPARRSARSSTAAGWGPTGRCGAARSS